MIVAIVDESIDTLAAKYGQSKDKILSDNQMSAVRRGVRLWIGGTVTHVVKPCETIESIAAYLGIDPKQIKDANPNPLTVGTKLIIDI